MGNDELLNLIKKETLSGLDGVFPIDEAWVNRSLFPALPEVLSKSGWSYRKALIAVGAVMLLLVVPVGILITNLTSEQTHYSFDWGGEEQSHSSEPLSQSSSEESTSMTTET